MMKMDESTQEIFTSQLNVSRETLDIFSVYGETLAKWQSKINLISGKTLDNVWRRHFLDCAQLHNLLPSGTKNILDIGSGAGFPGLVLAVMGVKNVTLVEADSKKCLFLSEVVRRTGRHANIVNCRIEEFDGGHFDVITARALAPMDKLLALHKSTLRPKTKGIFLKGERVDRELTKAKKQWKLKYKTIPSITSDGGSIIIVEKISSGSE
jgi:16S rRNA (guanine527-N7)-methyltransferase